MKVSAELRDEWIECPHCAFEFVPNEARRTANHRKEDNSAYIYLSVGAVVILGLIFVLSGGEPKPQPQPEQQEVIETGKRNPRVADMIKWVEAVSNGDRLGVAARMEEGAMRRSLELGTLDGSAQDRRERVLDELTAAERFAFLRDVEPIGGAVPEAEANADEGKVSISVYVREAPEIRARYVHRNGKVEVGFVRREGRTLATSLRVTSVPEAPAVPVEIRSGDKPRIGPTTTETRIVGGEEVEAIVSEIRPMAHLDDTSPEDRRKIDQWVNRMLDEENPAGPGPVTFNLREIAKPSIPRLLNAIHKLTKETPSSDDVNRKLKAIDAVLCDLTGQSFGFDPSSNSVMGRTGAEAAAADRDRDITLREWFGWWDTQGWRTEFDYAIDEDPFEEEAAEEAERRGDRARRR